MVCSDDTSARVDVNFFLALVQACDAGMYMLAVSGLVGRAGVALHSPVILF